MRKKIRYLTLIFITAAIILTGQANGQSGDIFYRQPIRIGQEAVRVAEWHPSGAFIAVPADSRGIDLYNDELELVTTLPIETDFWAGDYFKWSSNGEWLSIAIDNASRDVQLWRFDIESETFSFHSNFSTNSYVLISNTLVWRFDLTTATPQQFAVTSNQSRGPDTIAIVNVTSNGHELVNQWALPTRTSQIAWHPDGTRLATVDVDFMIRVWNSTNGELLQEFPIPSRSNNLQWRPDGLQLAITPDDHLVSIFDAQSGQEIRQLDSHDGLIVDLNWTPYGLLSSGNDNRTLLWDVEKAQTVQSFTHTQGRSVQVSPDPSTGGRLIALAHGVQLQIADVQSGRILFQRDGYLGSELINMTWHPNDSLVATYDSGGIRVWDALSGNLIQMHANVGAILDVSWHPTDMRLAASNSNSRETIIIEIDNPQNPPQIIGGLSGQLAWSPNVAIP